MFIGKVIFEMSSTELQLFYQGGPEHVEKKPEKLVSEASLPCFLGCTSPYPVFPSQPPEAPLLLCGTWEEVRSV